MPTEVHEDDRNRPFRLRCKLCGTVAESWHRTTRAPVGATIGMASCACGNLRVDSLGVPDKGRVLCKQPDSYEDV